MLSKKPTTRANTSEWLNSGNEQPRKPPRDCRGCDTNTRRYSSINIDCHDIDRVIGRDTWEITLSTCYYNATYLIQLNIKQFSITTPKLHAIKSNFISHKSPTSLWIKLIRSKLTVRTALMPLPLPYSIRAQMGLQYSKVHRHHIKSAPDKWIALLD